MVPIVMIVIYLIVAGIAHLVVNIMSTRSNYKKTLSLVSFCGIIAIIEQIIGTVVSRCAESTASNRPRISSSA